jgi:hypothetical protein
VLSPLDPREWPALLNVTAKKAAANVRSFQAQVICKQIGLMHVCSTETEKSILRFAVFWFATLIDDLEGLILQIYHNP